MKIVPAAGIAFCILFGSFASRAQDISTPTQGNVSESPALSVAPSSANPQASGNFTVSKWTDSLGIVLVGTSRTDSITVTNTAKTTLTISSVTSSNPQFTVGPTSASLGSNRSRKFGIKFTPTSPGTWTSLIIFVHSGATTPDTVLAWGQGIAPAFTVDHESVPFGFVPIASVKVDSVTVTNTGSANLNISNITSSNPDFAVNPSSGTLNPGTTMKVRITFIPLVSGLESGFIVFRHNATGGSDTVAVSGTGTAFSVNTRSLAFNKILIGTHERDSVFVTNTGSTMLNINDVVSTMGQFTVSPIVTSIPPTTTRTFTITFTPTDTSQVVGNLVFTHSATSSPDTVTLSGTGFAINPEFSINRKFIAFDTVHVGKTKTDSVRVVNTGSKTLHIDSVLATNSLFTVTPTGDSLVPGEQASFFITFAPTNSTPEAGNIIFYHNAPGSPDTVTVTGTGAVPGFSLNRRTVVFGYQRVGARIHDSVAVTNTGTAPLSISSVLSSSGVFVVNPTSDTVAPGVTRFFAIEFAPTDTVPYTGIIVFTYNADATHDTVHVSGTGTLAQFSVSRTALSFGYVTIGADKSDTIVVTNTGSSTLILSAVTVNNAAFSVDPGPVALAPGQSQTYQITFTPLNINPQTGALVFTHNAGNAPDTVLASGTGTVSVFTVNKRSISFGQVPVGTTAQDSVTVTNNGASTLLIYNVSSTNATFTVSPANGSISVGGHATFRIEFTPLNASSQAGNIIFTHIASSSPDSIRVSGAGSLAAIAFDRKDISFGQVLIGDSKADSVVVTNTGASALVISSAVSDNARFTVNPSSASIQPTTKRTFTITYTPQDTLPQSGHILFTHNAPGLRDTVTASGAGRTPLLAPALLSPEDGAINQTMPVVLSWTSVGGASGYLLELATDPSFTTIVLRDPSLVTPTRQVNGLPANTKFYWHVSTRSAAGAGPWSTSRTLTTLSSAYLSQTINFSGDLSQSSYKLFGLPGVGTRTVASILSGAQKVDWRMLRDAGEDTTYPAYYEDLTADSVMKPGEGYWLLLKKDLSISRTDTLPTLDTDGTYSIAIHQGWNIISDPFTVSIDRSAILAANGLPSATLFWQYDGTTTSSSGTTVDPYKGYYFFNDSSGLAALRIPYPFSTLVSKRSEATAVEWKVEIEFRSDQSIDRDNYIGVAAQVDQGMNALDQREPPLFFDRAFLYFPHPEWDARYPRFATDFRSQIGDGQAWDLEVWNPRGGTGEIRLHGVESVPERYNVVLVGMANTSPADMRRTNSFTYQTVSNRMRFRLLIGTQDYVHTELAKLVPQTFALEQNYPNPFNPKTVISGQWTVNSVVRLAVYDILGREVAVLADGHYAAGKYTFTFDGTHLSSGVYFYRLTAGSHTAVRKMTLLK